MRAILYIILSACTAASAVSCASVASNNDGLPPAYDKSPQARLVTDSLRWADTITMGGCTATAVVAGQYPLSGHQPLVDSIQAWLGKRLSYGMITSGSPMFTPSPRELTSGRRLVARAGMTMIDEARSDFKGLMADDIAVTYEYMFDFGPTYQSDSIVTYGFNGYVFLGGAHGTALGTGQSFNSNTGLSLNARNIFVAGRMPQLISMIREGLCNQYFKDNAAAGQTLQDALLINPDSLQLPSTPPLFGPDGLIFIYQQYEIAPYSEGMPACVLPYSTLKPLMRPEIARLI